MATMRDQRGRARTDDGPRSKTTQRMALPRSCPLGQPRGCLSFRLRALASPMQERWGEGGEWSVAGDRRGSRPFRPHRGADVHGGQPCACRKDYPICRFTVAGVQLRTETRWTSDCSFFQEIERLTCCFALVASGQGIGLARMGCGLGCSLKKKTSWSRSSSPGGQRWGLTRVGAV
jgi:hypothetical protein